MDGNKIHWLWFGVVTILTGVAAWTLSSIVDLRENVKTLATNQIWVMESIKLMDKGLAENRELIIRHIINGQDGKDKYRDIQPNPP